MPGVLSRFNGTLPFVFSVDGRKIGPGYEPPTLSEISRGLGKLCRFAGNCRVFWPVLLHSMVVADLVAPEVELYALLHDAAEVVFNDTPTPFKPPFFEAREAAVLRNLFESLKVPQPTEAVWKRVKVADTAALHAEAFVLGPRGLAEHLGDRESHTEILVKNYLREYEPRDYITEGRATFEFECRAKLAADRLKRGGA
jgi:hypothetical protein